MSERENFDWNDDTSFAGLNDDKAAESEGLGYPEDSFSDMEDLPPIDSLADDESLLDLESDPLASPDESSESSTPSAATDEPAAEAEEPRSPEVKRKKINIPVYGLTTLFVFTVIVASLGMGGALIYVKNVDPFSMWNPGGLVQWDQILDFQLHPWNLLYFVAAGTLLLSFLGGWAMRSALKMASARLRYADELLNKIAVLRLDDEQPWLDPALKRDPGMFAFVSETLGSHRMLESRLKRYVGFEGELRRLEQAVADDNRDEIAGRYDHPSIGSLSDALARYYDTKQQAMAEADNVRKKDKHEAESVIEVVQDARGWNRSTHDQVGIQGAALERLASRIGELSQAIAGAAQAQGDVSAQQDLLGSLQQGLAGLKQAEGSGVGKAAAELNELVDQGSKLAFQVAMEVARLGQRGERLLPMTQTLEELTTNFREVVTRLQDGGGDKTEDVLGTLQSQLRKLQELLTGSQDQNWKQMAGQAAEMGPVAGTVARNLEEISRNFNGQSERLVKLGQSVSELASVEFDASEQASGNPDNPPEGSLKITANDPFGRGAEPAVTTPEVEVDPFAGAEPLLGDPVSTGPDLDFSDSVTPGSEQTFTLDEDPTDLPEPLVMETGWQDPSGDVELPDTVESVLDPEPESLVEEPQSVVSDPEEKVYDLSEFGAAPVDGLADADEDGEEIHELSEFGAVKLA